MPKHSKTKRIPKTEQVAESPPPFKVVSASVAVSEDEDIAKIEEGKYVIENHDMPYIKTKYHNGMYKFFRIHTLEERSNPHANIPPHPGLRGPNLFGVGK